ncbi:hypothetical protein VNO78_23921 [Psophocarpus tetragonolobus]|uniref:Uncharacterized protein n=1 Tax=Psophocarpus tetragonolobus TaxID=3891 RepID=A0AAN9S3V2_PSOTE
MSTQSVMLSKSNSPKIKLRTDRGGDRVSRAQIAAEIAPRAPKSRRRSRFGRPPRSRRDGDRFDRRFSGSSSRFDRPDPVGSWGFSADQPGRPLQRLFVAVPPPVPAVLHRVFVPDPDGSGRFGASRDACSTAIPRELPVGAGSPALQQRRRKHRRRWFCAGTVSGVHKPEETK